MALPGHRRTSSHKRRRASHFALKQKNLAVCPKCRGPVMPHRVCAACGVYAGRQVIKLKSPVAKAKAKAKPEKAEKTPKKEGKASK